MTGYHIATHLDVEMLLNSSTSVHHANVSQMIIGTFLSATTHHMTNCITVCDGPYKPFTRRIPLPWTCSIYSGMGSSLSRTLNQCHCQSTFLTTLPHYTLLKESLVGINCYMDKSPFPGHIT